MPGLNKVQLIGRLGNDPEPRFTPKGNKLVQFRVAVSRKWKNREGEPQERTDWFPIEVWGRLAEVCETYLHKGSLVYLEGRLQTDQYEHDGETRFFTKVVLQEMQMLGPRSSEAVEEEIDIETLEPEG